MINGSARKRGRSAHTPIKHQDVEKGDREVSTWKRVDRIYLVATKLTSYLYMQDER